MQIKFPQLRDAGIYECQVSTEPKMSMAFRLNVVGKFDFFFCIFLYIHNKHIYEGYNLYIHKM